MVLDGWYLLAKMLEAFWEKHRTYAAWYPPLTPMPTYRIPFVVALPIRRSVFSQCSLAQSMIMSSFFKNGMSPSSTVSPTWPCGKDQTKTFGLLPKAWRERVSSQFLNIFEIPQQLQRIIAKG